MSRSRIRHRGEAPRDIDHGPSTGAAHAQGAAAAVARLGAFTTASLVPSGGAGPVERRMATDAQREAWRAADGPPARASIEDIPTSSPWRPEPGSIAEREAARTHAARVLAAVTGPTVTARTIEEEPAMGSMLHEEPVESRSHLEQDPPETLGIRIAVVAEAAAAASDAWSELQMAAAAERAAEAALVAAETRWDDARAALEASWRSTGIGPAIGPSVWEAEQRHEQLLNGDRPAVVESPADHAETIPVPDGLTDPRPIAPSLDSTTESSEPADALEVVTRRLGPIAAAGGGPGPQLSTQQARVLASALKHGGNFKAIADEVGTSRQNARLALDAVGKKGLLPIDLIPRLPAGFAKYSGV